MRETLSRERLFAVSLVRLPKDGTPAISGAVLELVYRRKLGKNGLCSSRTQSSP